MTLNDRLFSSREMHLKPLKTLRNPQYTQRYAYSTKNCELSVNVV